LTKVNEAKNLERIQELSEFIIGIKARMSKSVIGENGVRPLIMAKSLQKSELTTHGTYWDSAS
jgi:dihydroorotase